MTNPSTPNRHPDRPRGLLRRLADTVATRWSGNSRYAAQNGPQKPSSAARGDHETAAHVDTAGQSVAPEGLTEARELRAALYNALSYENTPIGFYHDEFGMDEFPESNASADLEDRLVRHLSAHPELLRLDEWADFTDVTVATSDTQSGEAAEAFTARPADPPPPPRQAAAHQAARLYTSPAGDGSQPPHAARTTPTPATGAQHDTGPITPSPSPMPVPGAPRPRHTA